MTFFDLVEAEGRLLRKHAFRLMLAICVGISAVLALFAALLLIGGAIFAAFYPLVGTAWALVILAAYTLLVAGALTWIARTIVQNRPPAR